MKGLKPFFSFYGGKWRTALRYPPPQHEMIVEPFAGSAGYSVRYFDRKIRLVDVDPVIVGVWDYLIHAKPEEILILPERVEHVDDVRGPQEARWLIGFWLNKGTAAPCKTPSHWMRHSLTGAYKESGGSGASNWWGTVIRERVASQVESIRHWRVAVGSYMEVPNPTATWFIDPPYSGSVGRRYTHHSIDYGVLATFSRGRAGQVIVCENDGASWLPFRPFLRAKASPGRQKRTWHSAEAIWIGTEGEGVDIFAEPE